MGNVGTAEGLLCDGHADLVSLGRDALANPDWPARVRSGDPLEHFDPHMLHPSATLEYADSWLAMRSRQ
jgi:2,4-dienoyl-CoA reductase-like NADH-dependent reductase (Old Yellow Enzyme family)